LDRCSFMFYPRITFLGLLFLSSLYYRYVKFLNYHSYPPRRTTVRRKMYNFLLFLPIAIVLLRTRERSVLNLTRSTNRRLSLSVSLIIDVYRLFLFYYAWENQGFDFLETFSKLSFPYIFRFYRMFCVTCIFIPFVFLLLWTLSDYDERIIYVRGNESFVK
jgi:hypothetical protein